MKRFIQIFAVIFLITVFKEPVVMAQSSGGGWLIDTTIIPVTAGLWWGFTNNTNYPGAMDSMRAVVDGIELDLGLVDGQPGGPGADAQMNFLISRGFHVIPVDVYKNSSFYNWVQYYSDARYTEWQVEGEYGDTSYLQHNPNVMEEDNDGDTTFIRLKPNAVCGEKELMWGPYYSQYVYGLTDAGTLAPSQYTAVFRMKLEENPNPPVCLDTMVWSDNPETPICIIKVTQSAVAVGPWRITETYTIDSVIITLGQFKPYFDDYLIFEYNLLSDSSQSDILGEPIPQANTGDMAISSSGFDALKQRHYVEFKVIWLGNPNYLLSIDKVTVYDQKGLEVMTPNSPAVTNLYDQLDQLASYNSSIIGWLGRDEPNSIDQYAPIKRVNEILNSHSAAPSRLWLPLMGKWGGAFGNPGNPIGVYRLSPWKEMKKRIGDINVWQDIYYLDYPWCDTCPNSPADWRSANIEIAAVKNYKQAYELNPNFGVSLQCGEIHNDVAEQRNITDYELLYETNLALMYGAKFLSLYTYFAQRNTAACDEGLTCRAIVDLDPSGSLIYTDKYTMLRYTIRPRLTGLFGKTLKGLTPVADSLGKNASPGYHTLNFNHVESIVLDTGIPDAYNSYVDVGLFNKPGEAEDNYFMVINRYYSDELNKKFKLKLRYLSDYNNWNLKNYVDSSNTTIIPDGNGEAISSSDTILVGDAILYSLKPVIKYGGTLLANETISGTQTLHDVMTIDNNTTLAINGTYNCEADIIVKNGNIVTSNGGTVNFLNGSKLIIEGSAFINGNASNNLVLNFSSSTGENGIVVNESGAYTIKYCNINNAETGINSLSSGTQIIQNTKFYNCSESAINIIGQTSDGQSTPPSPVIKDCYIIANQIGLQPGYGISVSNINEIEISNNYISNTKTGIFLSQVPQVYIINNTINGNTPVGPGIFMESSNGDIRGNTITNHLEGIHLGNSSPNIGTNTIYNNRKYGIYAGSGSIPNMVQQYAGNPPVFYYISGFNKIYNNGGYYELYGSDGSEIYLQNSNVLLNNGCNEIFDNRIPDEPPYQTGDLVNTQILINGSLPSGSRELKAENNFWDEHPIYPLSTRFGSLTVDYTPYSTTPCPPLQDEQFKLVMNSQGDIVDTVFSSGEINQDPTSLEVLYSEAEEKFLEGNYSEALTKYESVISLADSIFDKLKAYNRLYTIGRLTQKDEQYFSNLETIYNNAISQENDSLTNKILHQNSLLSKVSKGEYISAITGFDNIIQQNPNSEEAFYAEIDILTTSLLADTGNTQLGKIGNGKYLVKGSSDYMNKLNTLMKNHFGVEDKGKKEKIIPTEYTLFQNYPNPFNPVTIIRYDIPKAGNVELKVYDILGREVKVLVNEIKSAGRYEVEFNASDLASGIYIYRIQTPDFTKSQKMILVR